MAQFAVKLEGQPKVIGSWKTAALVKKSPVYFKLLCGQGTAHFSDHFPPAGM